MPGSDTISSGKLKFSCHEASSALVSLSDSKNREEHKSEIKKAGARLILLTEKPASSTMHSISAHGKQESLAVSA
jgi:hypothetical protein